MNHLSIWMVSFDILSPARTAAENNEFRVHILYLSEGLIAFLDYPRRAHNDDVLSVILFYILQGCFHGLVAANLRLEEQDKHLQLCRTLRVGVDPHDLVEKFHFDILG